MVTTKLYTVADLWDLGAEQANYELIEGELSEVTPVKHKHALVHLKIGSLVLAFVETHQLGEVGVEEGFVFHRNPDTVLAPDVAFTSNSRLDSDGPRWTEVPPDLVVEVVSPSNTRAEIDRKLRIYLDNGVQVVWNVRPDVRTITTHQPGSPPLVLSADDTLTGGDILPGFEVPVAEVFGT